VPFSLSHLDNETVTNEMNERKKERKIKGKTEWRDNIQIRAETFPVQ
jgi:hypothetical protein